MDANRIVSNTLTVTVVQPVSVTIYGTSSTAVVVRIARGNDDDLVDTTSIIIQYSMC